MPIGYSNEGNHLWENTLPSYMSERDSLWDNTVPSGVPDSRMSSRILCQESTPSPPPLVVNDEGCLYPRAVVDINYGQSGYLSEISETDQDQPVDKHRRKGHIRNPIFVDAVQTVEFNDMDPHVTTTANSRGWTLLREESHSSYNISDKPVRVESLPAKEMIWPGMVKDSPAKESGSGYSRKTFLRFSVAVAHAKYVYQRFSHLLSQMDQGSMPDAEQIDHATPNTILFMVFSKLLIRQSYQK